MQSVQGSLDTHLLQYRNSSTTTHLAIQRYIEEKYADCYEANIHCTYEHLLYVTNADDQYVAAVGYRQTKDTFFLEQYLEEAAESVLSNLYGEKVQRSNIVEIGNLVGDNSYAVFFLMQELWVHLHNANYEHVILTCTKKLQRRFRNLPLTTLALATRENVRQPEHWGSYYDQSPHVMTGKLSSYDNRFSIRRNHRELSIGHSHCQSIRK